VKAIFYHPAELCPRPSGSGIRPHKMILELQKACENVYVVAGNSKERKLKVREIKKNINLGLKVDFIYFENKSSPVTLSIIRLVGIAFPFPCFFDLFFLLFCARRGIKIGYYFRDIHWDFGYIYEGVVGWFGVILLKMFGRLELMFLKKFIKHIFVPTGAFAEYLQNKYKIFSRPLPPGSDLELCPAKNYSNNNLRIGYVGGSGALYDPRTLFSAMSLLPKSITLSYCTRKTEWELVKSKYQLPQNVRIVHFSGNELIDFYRNCDVTIYPLPPAREYSRMAFSFKIPEYLCAGKPVIVFDGTAVSDFIINNNLGWSVGDNAVDLANLMLFLANGHDEILRKIDNVIKFRPQLSWTNTVRTLFEYLQLEACQA